jgi:hypothetical protein
MTLAKHKIPEPHIKVKDAAEYFVNTPGATLAGAAKYCGVTVPRMRELLQMPHNLSYVRRAKALAIEALAASCPAALGKVIEENSNAMATVAAAKTVLSQARESEQSREAAKPMAGLLIVIGDHRGERSISVGPQPRLAGAPRIEDLAYERGPDRDDDALDGDELLDEPAPARVRRGTRAD